MDMRLEVINEDDLEDSTREFLSALLREAFPHNARQYADRGYLRLRPEFRVLAYSAGADLIGQILAFPAPARNVDGVYGFGDLVVVPGYRGQRVGESLVLRCVDECRARGAKAILGSMQRASVQSVLLRIGFEKVSAFRVVRKHDDVTLTRDSWWLLDPEAMTPARIEMDVEIF